MTFFKTLAVGLSIVGMVACSGAADPEPSGSGTESVASEKGGTAVEAEKVLPESCGYEDHVCVGGNGTLYSNLTECKAACKSPHYCKGLDYCCNGVCP